MSLALSRTVIGRTAVRIPHPHPKCLAATSRAVKQTECHLASTILPSTILPSSPEKSIPDTSDSAPLTVLADTSTCVTFDRYSVPETTIKSTVLTKWSDPAYDKNDMTVIFVLGGPGSGKGTNCTRLVRDFGFVHLSAGDLLREEQKRTDSEFGEMIRHYIKEGLIVPSDIPIALLRNEMRRSGKSRFLIDGFPRAMDQAIQFEKKVAKGRAVLYFECPKRELLQRLLKRGITSGRADDNVESIRKRFRTFYEISYPVIEYYRLQNKVFKIPCHQPQEKVYKETKRILVDILGVTERKMSATPSGAIPDFQLT